MPETRTAPFGFPGRSPRFRITGAATDPNLHTLEVDDGVYEPHLMRLLPRIVAPDAVIVDGGANIGIHSVLLAHLAPRGRVYAFEPGSENRTFLTRNLELNGVTNVEVVPLALSDRAGPATLAYDPAWPAGAFISTGGPNQPGQVSEPVERVRLDDWAAERRLGRLDLVKLDVEGSEVSALEGGRATLERFRPDLVIECNPMAIARAERRPPECLPELLRALYPAVALVTDRGGLVPLRSWGHLSAVLTRRGIVDLYCSARRPIPLNVRLAAALHHAALRLRYNRRRCPRETVVFRPAYDLGFHAERLTLRAGEEVELRGTLTNRGETWLSSRFRNGPVLLSYHWCHPDGSTALFEGHRTPLPRPLRPGASTPVSLRVEAPADPGDYVLEVTLLQDRWAWATDLDPSLAVRLPARVT